MIKKIFMLLLIVTMVTSVASMTTFQVANEHQPGPLTPPPPTEVL